MATISPRSVVDSATRLFAGDVGARAKTAAGIDEIVGRVATDLRATSPAELATIREAVVAAFTNTNEVRGGAGQKALGIAVDNRVAAPTVGRSSMLDVRAGGAVAANVLNAVTPLLEKDRLSDGQLTAGIAAIHNAWFAQAKGDGYRLGERDKADPVMKMARSFFVQVEARGGQLALKLDDSEKNFVRAYGRKQQPGVTLDDAAALAAGSTKILAEIKGNNQGALDESMRLVTAHLAGDIARVGAGDYLDAVKRMGDIKTPGPKPSLAPPSPEKAAALVEQRLNDLNTVVKVLNDAGDAPVRRASLPSSLHAAYDLLDEEHHRWVKTQVGYGVTSNSDFVRSDELPGKRLALDAAPLRGAYETLLAGLKSGALTPAAVNAILPLLEKGRLTPEQLTAGLALIHNDWYAKAKTDGYVLGERDKSDPVMKNARSFFVQVEARAGSLNLKLDANEAVFVRAYGRKHAPGQQLDDVTALKKGTEQIVAEIAKNNTGALEQTMKLVTGHLAGEVVRVGKDHYLDDVKALPEVRLPTATSAPMSADQAREGVDKLLGDVDAFLAFIAARAAKG